MRTLHEIAEQLRNSQTTNFPDLRAIADELDAMDKIIQKRTRDLVDK